MIARVSRYMQERHSWCLQARLEASLHTGWLPPSWCTCAILQCSMTDAMQVAVDHPKTRINSLIPGLDVWEMCKQGCHSPDAKSVGGMLHWAGSRGGAAMLAQQPSPDSTCDALSEDAFAVLIGVCRRCFMASVTRSNMVEHGRA
jgi:hypothetical protein